MLTWFEAAAADVLVNALADGLYLPLLAVGSAELQSPDLERHQPVGHLDHVHQAVQVKTGQHEAVALAHVAPSTWKK